VADFVERSAEPYRRCHVWASTDRQDYDFDVITSLTAGSFAEPLMTLTTSIMEAVEHDRRYTDGAAQCAQHFTAFDNLKFLKYSM
jgi:hypothetical protein